MAHPADTLCLTAPLIVGACGNGLPADFTAHLASRGIAIHPQRAHAPASDRDGHVVLAPDAQIATRIIAALDLAKAPADVLRLQFAISRANGPGVVREAWGVTGRPKRLRLANGTQFEYLFLVVAADGTIYLIAEYAYG